MPHRVLGSIFRRDAGKTEPSLNADDVIVAYQLLFSREPESPAVIELHLQNHVDVWSLLRALMDGPEYQSRLKDREQPVRKPENSQPEFVEPRTTLDWRPLLERYQQTHLPARPGYITNFLGVMTCVTYLADVREQPGHIESLPVNGNFHCSLSEWIACLRGVELAGDEFVVVELGAGWGPWMVNLSRAARMRGIQQTLAIGCEADTTHCEYLDRHLSENHLTQHARIYRGAIGLEPGYTVFPIPEDAANDWAMRPIFCASEQEAQAIVDDPQSYRDHRGITFRRFHGVPCYSLAQILEGVPLVDVLHIDIQGTEFELVRHNLERLKRQVRYLVIGTHSRTIEGALIETLRGEGWILEVEEPCQFDIRHPTHTVKIDGTQGWHNPTLTA